MPSDALVIAPAILAVVLVVSAVGKLRSPAASAQAFTALKVPRPLAGPLLVKALPWVEIVLGLALVVVGGPLGVIVSVAVLGLFAAYLALVVRARGFETDVDCACFGSVGPGRVTTLTVWRNAWLLALAVVSVVVATSGAALLARIIDGTAPWQWLLAAAAAALTVLLVLGTESESEPDQETPTVAVGDLAVDEGDYLRTRTPAVPVTLGTGHVTTLRALSSMRPVLVLHVSESCGSCVPVIERIPEFRARLPQLELRVLVSRPAGDSSLTSVDYPQSLHDEHSYVTDTLGYDLIPSAFLLGADGMLAGGPVTGVVQINDFVDDIEAELREATAVASSALETDQAL